MSEVIKNATTTAEPEQLRTEQPGQDPEENAAQIGDGATNERKFTQDEVNKIVKERLQRDRDKRSAEQSGQQTEQAAALEARAADLVARENRLTCKEFLVDNGYPHELLEAIDTSDTKEFERKALAVMNAVQSRPVSGLATPDFSAECVPHDIIAEGFSKEAKHKPKYGGMSDYPL